MAKTRYGAEKVIEKMILEYLKYRGIFAWKNNSTGIYDPRNKTFRAIKNPYVINGTSDILGVLPDGKLLAIEVKTPRGKATKEQQNFIDRINNNGGVALIARGLEEVVDALKEYEDEQKKASTLRDMEGDETKVHE